MLEKITNLTILAVALVVGFLYVTEYRQRHQLPAKPNIAHDLIVRQLPESPRLNGYLVLALSTECHFCTESMEFYRELSGIKSSRALVAMFPQSGAYTASSSLVGAYIVGGQDYGRLGIVGTPTLIAYGPDKKPIKTWLGKLTKVQEEEVRRFVQGT